MKSEDTKVEVAAWRVSAPSDCGWLLSVGDEHYYFEPSGDLKEGAFFKGFAFRSGSAPPTLRQIGDEALCPEDSFQKNADLFLGISAQVGGMSACGGGKVGLEGGVSRSQMFLVGFAEFFG